MAKIRLGKDITIQWLDIKTNGESTSLEGRDITLSLKLPNGKSINPSIDIVETNGIEFTYKGIDQQFTGVYSLTLWENYGKDGQTALDKTRSFELVATTDQEDYDDIPEGLDIETIELEGGDIVIGFKGDKGDKGDRGDNGVGISSIAQTTSSNVSEGENVVTITLTNGQTASFTIRNGKQGNPGNDGNPGVPGNDGITPVITTTKVGSVTTILANGIAIGTINDGAKGDDGDDYILTNADKQAIANLVNVPTLLSQLSNDSNYVQDANYQHTDNNYTNDDKTAVGNIAQLSQKVNALPTITIEDTTDANVVVYTKSDIDTKIGDISTLTTTATNLVSAINEVNAKPSGSGGSEPSAYIKSASVNGNTLTLTNKDNTTQTYTPTIPSIPTWNDIKPSDGIALTDLASTLQTSISRADEIYNDYVSAQNLI